jgi:hypothetical protein
MGATYKIFKTSFKDAKRNESAAPSRHPLSVPASPLRDPADAHLAEAVRMRQTQLLLYYVVATRGR